MPSRPPRQPADRAVGREPQIATLALFASAALLGLPSAVTQAAEATTVAQAAAIPFAIPAQPLASALTAFGQQAGLQVSFDPAVAAGLGSPGVTGSYTPDQALRALLAGTSTTASVADGGTVVLERAAEGVEGATVLGPITVEAHGSAPANAIIGSPPPPFAGGQVATGAQVGLLGNRDVFDTPFNQTSFTEQLIRDRQARNLADVALNDPSVRNFTGVAGTTDEFFIRGFSVQQADLGIDGLFGLFEGTRPGIEWVERVEILKGSSALLNGVPPRGSLGGTVNLIPKRAGDEPLARLTGSYASESQLGGHVDTGRRFGPNGEFGIRVNGAYRDGDMAVDHLDQSVGVGSGALDYRGERLRLAGDFIYTRQDINGANFGIGVLPGFAVPDAPDAQTNFAQPWQHADDTLKLGVGRAEFDLTDQITLYAAYGRSKIDEYFITPSNTIVNEESDFNATTSGLSSLLKADAFDLGTRSAFATGPIEHQVVVSASGYTRDSYFRSESILSYSSNIFDPVRVPKPDTSGVSHRVGRRNSEALARAVAVADTLSAFDERVLLTLGGRFQKLDSSKNAVFC